MRNKSLKSRLVMLTMLAALVMAFAATAMASEPESFKEALEMAKAQNKMLVIDFYTDW